MLLQEAPSYHDLPSWPGYLKLLEVAVEEMDAGTETLPDDDGEASQAWDCIWCAASMALGTSTLLHCYRMARLSVGPVQADQAVSEALIRWTLDKVMKGTGEQSKAMIDLLEIRLPGFVGSLEEERVALEAMRVAVSEEFASEEIQCDLVPLSSSRACLVVAVPFPKTAIYVSTDGGDLDYVAFFAVGTSHEQEIPSNLEHLPFVLRCAEEQRQRQL